MKEQSKKAARDNRANQLNPSHPAYYRSRGASPAHAKYLSKQLSLNRVLQQPQTTKPAASPEL